MPSLISILTGAGLGPRRQCFQTIVAGKVTVNGEVATGVTMDVDPTKADIRVNGKPLQHSGRKVYLKLNKPIGVVTTTSDDQGRPVVTDLVPPEYRSVRLFPVGRLDIDTSGLVLLTNDGELAYRLTHPRFEVEKEYHVLVDTPLTDGERAELEHGVEIEGKRTSPARVGALHGRERPWYRITIHEGRKRQVRLMFGAVGKPVRALRRVRIHTLRLGSLAEGEIREVSPDELAALRGERPAAPPRGNARRPGGSNRGGPHRPGAQGSRRPSGHPPRTRGSQGRTPPPRRPS